MSVAVLGSILAFLVHKKISSPRNLVRNRFVAVLPRATMPVGWVAHVPVNVFHHFMARLTNLRVGFLSC